MESKYNLEETEQQVSYSWDIYGENVAVKKCDFSFFEHNGSGIPKDMRWFWGVGDLGEGEKYFITLTYNNKKYDAYIRMGRTSKAITRIFWHSDLNNTFKELFPQYGEFEKKDFPSLLFKKESSTEYNIEFLSDDIESQRTFEFTSENDYKEIVIQSENEKEGKKVFYHVTRYERSAKNRKLCIAIHGTKCAVCGFDFKEVYGELGAGFIEVHHKELLSSKDEEIVINPETDLSPVCSNCHSMLHRDRNNVLSIEDLKEIICKNSN